MCRRAQAGCRNAEKACGVGGWGAGAASTVRPYVAPIVITPPLDFIYNRRLPAGQPKLQHQRVMISHDRTSEGCYQYRSEVSVTFSFAANNGGHSELYGR